MKTSNCTFQNNGKEYSAQITLIDNKIPNIYIVAFENLSNIQDKGVINLHDFCEGRGIEAGIKNQDQKIRDIIADRLNSLILQNRLLFTVEK